MAEADGLGFRAAGPEDAHAVADLHADSWRRHYRGALTDAFLDGDVVEDRLSVWSERLADGGSRSRTIVAERRGELLAFVHAIPDDDIVWGALIDNLHVAQALKRRGLGTRLLAMAARWVLDCSPSSGLYLWVLEQNTEGQAFYAACGGIPSGREHVPAPGGDATRLCGRPVGIRYAWKDPSRLL